MTTLKADTEYSYEHRGDTVVYVTTIRYGVTYTGRTVLPTRLTRAEAEEDLRVYGPQLESTLGFVGCKVSPVEAYPNGQTLRVIEELESDAI